MMGIGSWMDERYMSRQKVRDRVTTTLFIFNFSFVNEFFLLAMASRGSVGI